MPTPPHIRTVLLSLSFLAPVFAAAVDGPVIEPPNGFYRGVDIEWNDLHMNLDPSFDHDAFHSEWDLLERDWLSENAVSPFLEEEHRTWLQWRNALHRVWHQRALIEATAEDSDHDEETTVVEERTERVENRIYGTLPPLGGSRRLLEQRVRAMANMDPIDREDAVDVQTILSRNIAASQLLPPAGRGGSRPTAERRSRRLIIQDALERLEEMRKAIPALTDGSVRE